MEFIVVIFDLNRNVIAVFVVNFAPASGLLGARRQCVRDGRVGQEGVRVGRARVNRQGAAHHARLRARVLHGRVGPDDGCGRCRSANHAL
jgi:hypothetical protein